MDFVLLICTKRQTFSWGEVKLNEVFCLPTKPHKATIALPDGSLHKSLYVDYKHPTEATPHKNMISILTNIGALCAKTV